MEQEKASSATPSVASASVSERQPFLSSPPAISPLERDHIDLEAGPGEQPQCRICLESDGRDFIAPCKCKGSAKYVHRECLDHWRSVKEGFAFAHCTTCKALYHLRVQVPADRKWRTLKFRFFVTRDIIFIFLIVQLAGELATRGQIFKDAGLVRINGICVGCNDAYEGFIKAAEGPPIGRTKGSCNPPYVFVGWEWEKKEGKEDFVYIY